MARKSSSEPSSITRLERCTIVVLGVYLSTVGVRAATAGHFLYRNYIHSVIWAPLAILIGTVLVAAGVWMRD